MIHYPVLAIFLFAFQVLHTIYTPKMVEKYENNEFKFVFSFKRRVVALNVGLLVSLFVCICWYMGIWECGMYGNMGTYVWEYVCMYVCMYVYMYVCMYVWEYGNVVCMGIWECVYGNMGMWYVWEYGNVRTTVLIFLQQQNLFFQLISMCLHRPCLIYLQIKLFIIDNLLRPAP